MKSQTKSRLISIGICFGLILMVWAVFAQTLAFDFVGYDDDEYVYENERVQEGITAPGVLRVFTHSDYSFYHPLTTLSHMLDAQVYGMNPEGFHRTNVLLHSASAVLLFLVLRSMTGSLWRSALVAALFAIHPLRAESVAWITERKDTLSGFFFMLTLAAYVYYVRRAFSFWRYGLVALCMAAGMLSKSLLVTLPCVLLLLDFWPLGRWGETEDRRQGAEIRNRKLFFRLVAEKIPFLLLSAGVGFATLITASESLPSTENTPVFLRLSNAAVSYATYIVQTVFPVKLAAFYPYPAEPPPFWKIAASILLLTGITLWIFSNRWKKHSPSSNTPALQQSNTPLLIGWLWYLGMLVPVIGLVQAGAQAHADRYTYLSGIGLLVAGCWWMGTWADTRRRRVTLSVVAVVIVATLMALAHAQTAHWRNSETLWRRALTCTSGNYVAHNNLGLVLARQGKNEAAISHYEKAIQISPTYETAHLGLGNVLHRQNKDKEAAQCYQKLLQLNSEHSKANNNLAWVLSTSSDATLRNGERAVALAQKANRLAGGTNTSFLDTLAVAYAEAGRYPEAAATVRQAIKRLDPSKNTTRIEKLRARLRLYEQGFPYHEGN